NRSGQRVCILSWRDTVSEVLIREGIRRGLSRTRLPLYLDEAVCGGDSRKAETILKRWKREGIDLHVGIGAEATRFLSTRGEGKPLVFACTRNPVLAGILKEPARAAQNVTGAYLELEIRECLGLFQAMIPGLTDLGVLYTAELRGPVADVKAAEEVLQKPRVGETQTLRLRKGPVQREKGAAGVLHSLERLIADGARAVWIPDDPNLLQHLEAISRVAERSRVPLVATHPHGSRRHFVVGISPDYRRVGMHVAARVACILRDRTSPCVLPLGKVHTIHVVANLKAAHRTGVRIPLPALTRADVILERDGW
ncbi:MAG: ABC transporter substrate-binding protein, partial [Planctomycetota bacterium]